MVGGRWCVKAVALALLPVQAMSQSVRGSVVDRTATTPMGGVVVLLLDSADNAVARALTSPGGDYRLVAPVAGRYRVRTLRLGYRPSTTEAFELIAGREVARDVEVAAIPFLLDTVRAIGRNACRDRSGTDVASVVWEQARTALYATQISSRLPAIGATLLSYERVYDPGSTRIREQSTAMSSAITRAAWVSLPADSLGRVGYVVQDAEGWSSFYAPDVEVLLSREFQADHCFRLARSRDPGLTGVSFEPARERGNVADVKGTIWLDTKTSELSRLEFRYTNISSLQQDEGAGGHMEFVRLRNGGFAISEWSIRMPVVVLRSFSSRGALGGLGAPSGPQQRLAEVRVAGGALVAVTLRGDTLWVRPRLVVTGVVTDSTSGDRVPLAKVSFEGTGLQTVADARGRFAIADVLPGEYTLEVRTASMDSMNTRHRAAILVEPDAKPLTVRVPRADELANALCASDKTYRRATHRGIVLGTSRVFGDSLRPNNVSVAADWVEMQYKVAAGVPSGVGVRRWKETRTDSAGAFRLCGLPTNTPILIRVQGDSAHAAPVEVRIDKGRLFERVQLLVDRVSPTNPGTRPPD